MTWKRAVWENQESCIARSQLSYWTTSLRNEKLKKWLATFPALNIRRPSALRFSAVAKVISLYSTTWYSPSTLQTTPTASVGFVFSTTCKHHNTCVTITIFLHVIRTFCGGWGSFFSTFSRVRRSRSRPKGTRASVVKWCLHHKLINANVLSKRSWNVHCKSISRTEFSGFTANCTKPPLESWASR